jgi:adenylate cyclase, class 2
MARNLELKIKLNSHAKVLGLLKKINAEDAGILKQKDTYYKIKNGLLKLRCVNGKFVLIKYLRDEKGKKRWSDYELLSLEGKNPEKYLAELFQIDLVVEKKRALYLYEGTRIHLDKVKNLGTFLELETVVDKGLKDAERRFNNTVNLLQLDLNKQIKKSYKNLLEEK